MSPPFNESVTAEKITPTKPIWKASPNLESFPNPPTLEQKETCQKRILPEDNKSAIVPVGGKKGGNLKSESPP